MWGTLSLVHITLLSNIITISLFGRPGCPHAHLALHAGLCEACYCECDLSRGLQMSPLASHAEQNLPRLVQSFQVEYNVRESCMPLRAPSLDMLT